MFPIEHLHIGDVVKIVDEWEEPDWGRQESEGDMDHWLGKTMTVKDMASDFEYAKMIEDSTENFNDGWYWFPEMIECVIDEAEMQQAYESLETINVKDFL